MEVLPLTPRPGDIQKRPTLDVPCQCIDHLLVIETPKCHWTDSQALSPAAVSAESPRRCLTARRLHLCCRRPVRNVSHLCVCALFTGSAQPENSPAPLSPPRLARARALSRSSIWLPTHCLPASPRL